MENKKKEEQVEKRPDIKIIDYIDDMGNRRRTYTKDTAVETYIQNTYCVIQEFSQEENLTS
jgi:hypothetical protein